MEKDEFTRKLVLVVVEKGLIAIVIALVGLWINSSLKDIDHQNQMALQREISKREDQERTFNIDKIKLTGKLNKERDSLLSALRNSEINRLNDYKNFSIKQEQEFKKQQELLQKNHEKELINLKTTQEKTLQTDLLNLQSGLNRGIERMRADLELFHHLNLKSTEKIAEVWSKIYSLDFHSEELVRSIIEFDKNERTADSIRRTVVVGVGAPASLFGWREQKIIKKRKKYLKRKREVLTTLRTDQFWLSDSIIISINEYLNVMDLIVNQTKSEKFRFLFPKFKYQQSSLSLEELDSLVILKNRLRRTIFSEGKLIKNLNTDQ